MTTITRRNLLIIAAGLAVGVVFGGVLSGFAAVTNGWLWMGFLAVLTFLLGFVVHEIPPPDHTIKEILSGWNENRRAAQDARAQQAAQ